MLSARMRCVTSGALLVVIAVSLSGCAPTPVQPTSHAPATPAIPSPLPSPTDMPTPVLNKKLYSIDDPSSIWVVIDKLRPLNPANYVPADLIETPVAHLNPPTLRRVAADAIVAMFAAAQAEGAGGMQLQSAYRSYTTQVIVYNRYVASAGKAGADAQSARPGFSEHQTGLAADISARPLACALASCFGQTQQGVWLAANAYRFGFLLRYPADKVAVTGYMYEPWHFRYIGVDLATQMHTTGVTTLEEFFGLPAAPDYAP